VSILRPFSRVPRVLCIAFAAAVAGGCASAGTTTDPTRVDGTSYAAGRVLSIPRPFEVGIVSTDEDEYGAAFEPDGRTLYFVRRLTAGQSEQILFSRFTRGRWQTARLAGFSGTAYFDGDPGISPDGRRIVFASNRPLVSGQPTRTIDLWTLSRAARGWGSVERMEHVNSDAADEDPTLSTTALYFSSNRFGGLGGYDLWRSAATQNGFAAATALGAPVNSEGDETDPHVAPDESYLIFVADRVGGAGGRDLWVTYRSGDSWSTPEPLSGVNTGEDEYAPAVTPDGRYLFFTRGRPGNLLQMDIAATGIRTTSAPAP